MKSRLPLATLFLGALILLSSLLSITQIVPDSLQNQLSLHAGLIAQGESLWQPYTYWLFTQSPSSLLVILLPFALFSPSIEKHFGPAGVLSIFALGILGGALIFVLLFFSRGGVVSGALPGSISLTGAAILLSLFKKLPRTNNVLPFWALGLAFLAGTAWVSYIIPKDAKMLAVLFNLSPAIVGMLAALFFLRRKPSDKKTTP